MAEFTRAVGVIEDGTFLWVEDVTRDGELFRLAIRYPEAFPLECPRSYVVVPSVLEAPHRLLDGSLCIFGDPIHGNGVKTTAVVVRNRTLLWIDAYRSWRRTRIWPE
jgi:hypothetical protein